MMWGAGRTRWRLWPSQQVLYDDVRAKWGLGPYYTMDHRNFGKSTVLITIADEECRRARNTPCAILTDTKDHASKIADQKMDEYLDTCPPPLRPVKAGSKYVWQYPNGSKLWLFGADDSKHVKTIRGLGFRFIGLDEAGHIEGSKNVTTGVIVRSILLPALAKFTKVHPDRPGQLLGATTAPRTPGHDFWDLYDEAEADGRTHHLPLSKNKDFSAEYRAARAKECGGFKSIDYLIEYECRRVSDPKTTVLPAVSATTEDADGKQVYTRIHGLDGKPALVQPLDILMLREWYRSMDIGGKHMTGVLWGYYESEDDSVRIVRELTDRNASETELAAGIQATELSLWPQMRPQYLEGWADTNNVYLLHNLHTTYKITFKPTRKDEKMAQIGILRKMISEGKFIISPECPQLLATLKRAQWSETGNTNKGFAEDPAIGHADLLDAALYLVRNVKRRPFPIAMPSIQAQIGVPEYGEKALRTPGMRALRQRLNTEGWEAEA